MSLALLGIAASRAGPTNRITYSTYLGVKEILCISITTIPNLAQHGGHWLVVLFFVQHFCFFSHSVMFYVYSIFILKCKQTLTYQIALEHKNQFSLEWRPIRKRYVFWHLCWFLRTIIMASHYAHWYNEGNWLLKLKSPYIRLGMNGCM